MSESTNLRLKGLRLKLGGAVMNGNGSYVISLVYSLSDFPISISVLIRFQLYSMRHCYWIFATQEKRSATALRDVEQRCSPAGVSLTSPRAPLGKHFP
jgi:hypothetical protein